jgi:hypothetical protein
LVSSRCRQAPEGGVRQLPPAEAGGFERFSSISPEGATQNRQHCAICAAPFGGCSYPRRGCFPGSCEPG